MTTALPPRLLSQSRHAILSRALRDLLALSSSSFEPVFVRSCRIFSGYLLSMSQHDGNDYYVVMPVDSPFAASGLAKCVSGEWHLPSARSSPRAHLAPLGGRGAPSSLRMGYRPQLPRRAASRAHGRRFQSRSPGLAWPSSGGCWPRRRLSARRDSTTLNAGMNLRSATANASVGATSTAISVTRAPSAASRRLLD